MEIISSEKKEAKRNQLLQQLNQPKPGVQDDSTPLTITQLITSTFKKVLLQQVVRSDKSIPSPFFSCCNRKTKSPPFTDAISFTQKFSIIQQICRQVY